MSTPTPIYTIRLTGKELTMIIAALQWAKRLPGATELALKLLMRVTK